MAFRVIVYVTAISFFVAGCSAPRQSSSAGRSSASQPKVVNKNPKFLDDISINAQSSSTTVRHNNTNERNYSSVPESPDARKAFSLQLKYSLLLNVNVEEITNEKLFSFIDEWYGTRYCLGGTTKSCIDCSAFVQTFFSAIYGITIPRTSKAQYSFANKISSKNLQEGDLLFFNTSGGVSHVGIYLMNNRFVHASTSNGVMISDLAETYYAKRFISAGRVNNQVETAGKSF